MDENFKKAQEIKVKQSSEKISEVKERYLKTLNALRSYDVKKSSPEIRTVFFGNVSGIIMVLKTMKLISNSETKKECEEFLEFLKSSRGTRRIYTQDDIDKANRVLDSLIKELS